MSAFFAAEVSAFFAVSAFLVESSGAATGCGFGTMAGITVAWPVSGRDFGAGADGGAALEADPFRDSPCFFASAALTMFGELLWPV